MLRLELTDGVICLDRESLPQDKDFEHFVSRLSPASVRSSTLVQIAVLYRSNYENARRILDIAAAAAEEAENGERDNVKIAQLALEVFHQRAKEEDFYLLNNMYDKRVDFLKGFFLFKRKNYEDAYFLFSKVAYKLGMELCCAVMGQNWQPATDERVRCYVSAREWDNFSNKEAHPDFLFRIGKSTKYADENNVDVVLTRIEKALASNSCEYRGCLDQLAVLQEEYPDSSEIMYLRGKIYHIMKDYERAKECYEAVLLKDPEYLPAEFNLRRIEGSPVNTNVKHASLCDYEALINIKNKKVGFLWNGCSDLVRKVCMAAEASCGAHSGADKVLESLLNDAQMTNVFDKEAIMNNIGVLCAQNNKEKAICTLNEALGSSAMKYEDYIRYNLGVLSGDTKMLGEVVFPEARLVCELLNQDINTADPQLKAFLMMKSDPEASRNLFKKMMGGSYNRGRKEAFVGSHLFAALCLGKIYIDEYLEKGCEKALREAVKLLERVPRSFYAVNGLGICYALRGRIGVAIQLFSQILEDYNGAYYNLAVCYKICGNMESAAAALMRLQAQNINEAAEELAEDICSAVGDTAVINGLIAAGFVGLERMKKSAEKNDTIFETNKEEAKKRKIQEIAEYRKKLQLE